MTLGTYFEIVNRSTGGCNGAAFRPPPQMSAARIMRSGASASPVDETSDYHRSADARRAIFDSTALPPRTQPRPRDSTTYRTRDRPAASGGRSRSGWSRGDGWRAPSTSLIPSPGLWSILVASHSEPAESPGQVSTGGTQSREPNWIVRARQVELVRTAGEWSQLQGPLAGSDLLILEGTHRVTEGQKVRCDSSLSCEPLVGGSTDENPQP